MHDEDPRRKELHRDLPTHPPDPAAAGDEQKVVNDGGAVRTRDYNDPPPEGSPGKSMGNAVDPQVGGALGQPAGESDAAGHRSEETRAEDVNDRRTES